MLEQKDEMTRREALLSQIKYYKYVNRGIIKGHLFFNTSAGKPIATPQLAKNLKEILNQLNVAESPVDACSVSSNSSKDKSRMELKASLLAKLNRVVQNKPFPADIVGKKVEHICLSPDGTLETYRGKILRESTTKDIKELMGDEYKSFLEKGYKFYTLRYEPPYNQLFVYPLKKEWDDNLLSIL